MNPMRPLRRINTRIITFARSIGLGCCIYGLISSIVVAQGTVQRDQEALAIVNQAISAAGGEDSLTSISDFVETGTVTYYSGDQVTGNITVKSRGLHQLRMDDELPSGQRSIVINNDSHVMIDPDGTIRPISRQTASDITGITFPYPTLMTAIHDLSISISYAGLVTYDGGSEYDIRIERIYPSWQDPDGTRSAHEVRDVYFDPTTYQVIRISDHIYFGEQGVSHDILFSNYKMENSVLLPMTITEKVRDVPLLTIQLTQATLNSGLSDADFAWQ